MAGCISGKRYWRVYYWRFPKHFPLLLKAERGTLCCTVVHQACFFHFPLICYCSPRSSRALIAVLWGALAAALLVAGIFLLLAHSGSSFINICDMNAGLHIIVGMHVGLFPKCWCWRAVFYTAIKTPPTHRHQSCSASEKRFGCYYIKYYIITKLPWLWKVKALWLVWQGSPWPSTLLQMVAGMGLLSIATSFSSPLWGWAESVHTTSSFIPLAQVCVYPGCCTFQLSHFFSVVEVNDFVLVLASTWDISKGFSLGIYAALPWCFVSGGLYFLRDFSQPSVPVPCWRACCPCSGRQEGTASPLLLKMCVFVFLMFVYELNEPVLMI